jgi:hypothetical protein
MFHERFIVSATIEPSFTDVVHGVFKIDGELSYSNETLTFDYRRSGFFRKTGDTQRWSVSLEDLREVRFRRMGTEARIRVSPRTLHVLDGLPGDNAASVVFRVAGTERKVAREMVSLVEGILSDQHEYEVAGVPFQIPELNTGFREVRGVMYLEPEMFVLDVESGIPGGFKRDRHTVKLATHAIATIESKRGVIYDRISVRPVDQSHFDRLPWPIVGKLTLRIARKHRREADSIVRLVRMRMDLPGL